MKTYLTILPLIMLFTACKKETPSSQPPQISSINVTPNTVKSGAVEDTVLVTFDLSDEDGNIGYGSSSQDIDIYLEDNRGSGVLPFYFPDIPQGITDGNALVAKCTLRIPASQYLFLRPDPLHAERDTVWFDLHVVDRSGLGSNKLRTPNIYILK